MSASPRLSLLRCARCGRRCGKRACVIAFPPGGELLAWDSVEHARLDGWPWLASELPSLPAAKETA